jgi:hypothetical protein
MFKLFITGDKEFDPHPALSMLAACKIRISKSFFFNPGDFSVRNGEAGKIRYTQYTAYTQKNFEAKVFTQ